MAAVDPLRILVVGGGGREQAIAWACRRHGHDVRVATGLGDAAPGDTDLVIPGPEAALGQGLEPSTGTPRAR